MIAALACAAGCGPQDAADRGHQLYSDPAFSQAPSNAFACGTCHSDAPAAGLPGRGGDGRRYAGYTLYGAAYRTAFWNGGFSLLLDAVSFCAVQFMNASAVAPDDPAGLALLAYLKTLGGPGPDPALPCTVVRNIDATYLASLPKGDAGRGGDLYRAACATCHGDLHTGNGRLSGRVSIIPEATVATFGAAVAPVAVAEKVRHGKFFGISGVMPLYCTELLGDAELADLLAYVFS